jgi:hypothetical protein
MSVIRIVNSEAESGHYTIIGAASEMTEVPISRR